MKLNKKIFVGISWFLGFIIAGCLVIIVVGSCHKKYKEASEESSFWMKNLEDELLLTDVVIPGSHDACTYSMPWLTETQYLTIDEQLKSGVRYFDIRVRKDKKDRYVIYHGPVNGVLFDPIIESIIGFLKNNKSETLILDFQHFENGSEEYVFKKINEKLLG